MLTLAQAKATMVDPVDQMVIDEFRRGSWLLDNLVFDNAVAPATGGSTLVYGYTKLLTPSGAQTRKINETYEASQAKRKRENAYLKILGGEFELDRVIINTSGSIDELSFQMQQKIKATANLFNWLAINGVDSADENTAEEESEEFDGLKVLLSGSDTEVDANIDLSTAEKKDANTQEFLDIVDEWVRSLVEKPNAFLTNSKGVAILKHCARRAGYYSRSEDAFGRTVDNYDNIPIIDLEKYYDAENDVSKDCVAIEEDGTTSIYAVCIGLDKFLGVSPQGDKIISQHTPDLNEPGVIKKGDVEIVCAVALKNSRAAGRLYGIKVVEPVGPEPEPTTISLNKETTSIVKDATETLVATLDPEDATDEITWATSDATKATVADGVVTGVAEGSATITASLANGNKAECVVTVTAE